MLSAFERCGAASPRYGWTPLHATLLEGGKIVGAAPLYVKENSHGEFVFDWAWADAYHRHGMSYYPKLLCAVPFSPIQGPRLLVRRDRRDAGQIRRRLVDAILQESKRRETSTVHFNFVLGEDAEALDRTNLLPRIDWQFHWRNRHYQTFDQFLGTLNAKKRKNIRHERRRVHDAGFRFERVSGRQATDGQLQAAYDCYRITFHYKGNTAVLSPEFFQALAGAPDDPLMLVLAKNGDDYVGAAVFVQGGGALFGRYWGCYEEFPGLHFETCYYQGLEHCIESGLDTFEPGAQGPHKISRGFLPTQVRSFHYVRHPEFRRAIAAHLREERQQRAEAGEWLAERSPYRADLDVDFDS